MGSYFNTFSSQLEDKAVFISATKGYRSISIYHDGNLIKSFDGTSELSKGVSFEYDLLGTVEIQFSRPTLVKFTVKINGENCKPNESFRQRESFTNLPYLFWAFATVRLVRLLIILINSDFESVMESSSFGTLFIAYEVVFLVGYIIAGLILLKGKSEGYILGLALFIAAACINTALMYDEFPIRLNYFFIGYRVLMLLFLLTYFKKAISILNESKKVELLDN